MLDGQCKQLMEPAHPYAAPGHRAGQEADVIAATGFEHQMGVELVGVLFGFGDGRIVLHSA